MLSLQRVHTRRTLLSVLFSKLQRRRCSSLTSMLRPLPTTTIGDVALHGLESHVYCARCYATRRVSIDSDDRLHGLNFATARFRCRSGRAKGEVCGCPGAAQIRPAALVDGWARPRRSLLLPWLRRAGRLAHPRADLAALL